MDWSTLAMQCWCWSCKKMRVSSTGFFWLPAYCSWWQIKGMPGLPHERYWPDHVSRIVLWNGEEQTHRFWRYFFLELDRWYCKWKSTACETFMVHLLNLWESGKHLYLIIPKKKNLVVERRLAISGRMLICGIVVKRFPCHDKYQFRRYLKAKFLDSKKAG